MSDTLQMLAATEKRLAQAVNTAQQLRTRLTTAEAALTQSGQAARAEKARADKAEAEAARYRTAIEKALRIFDDADGLDFLGHEWIFEELRAALADAGKGK